MAPEDRLIDKVISETREQLSQIISGSPIPTFVIDSNHIVTHFNKACEILTGISAESIIGTRDQWKAFYSEKRPVMADFILDEASEQNISEFYKEKYKPSKVKPGAYEAVDFFPAFGDDGKWLFFTAAPLTGIDGSVTGAIETLQDITTEKRVSRVNKAMLRISTALHEYSYLNDLLSYISGEIRELLGTEGALVILHDKEADELYFPGIAYDDPDREKRVREIRFSPDQIVAGKVIRSGEPVIVNDADGDSLFPERAKKLGYRTRSLVEVPIQSEDRIIGVLTGINKKEGAFNQNDVDLLNTLAGTVALAIEKTRYSEELRVAYREVTALNKAKGRAINHLSHELKTPVAIISDAVDMVEDELEPVPEEDWKPFVDMIHRNLKRITEIQEEVSDIMAEKKHRNSGIISWIIHQCVDELGLMMIKSMGKGESLEALRNLIDSRFSLKEEAYGLIDLSGFVETCISEALTKCTNRKVAIDFSSHDGRMVYIPHGILEKIVDGLIRNAIENTPDGGSIKITVNPRGNRTVLRVRDYGVGVEEDYQHRIFEGFFPTQEMTEYSTKKPYDFNAGGKGADLLRMKIFSEKYDFNIEMESTRCRYIKTSQEPCPGDVSVCSGCNSSDECGSLGGTEFILEFCLRGE